MRYITNYSFVIRNLYIAIVPISPKLHAHFMSTDPQQSACAHGMFSMGTRPDPDRNADSTLTPMITSATPPVESCILSHTVSRFKFQCYCDGAGAAVLYPPGAFNPEACCV